MANTLSPVMAQRIALFNHSPELRNPLDTMVKKLHNIGKAPVRINSNRSVTAEPGNINRSAAAKPGDINSSAAAKRGNILLKIKESMPEGEFARFCNTLQGVKKGNPQPHIKHPAKITAAATLPRTSAKAYDKPIGLSIGTMPVPPPPPPPPKLSQSLPELTKASWDRVKGATLEEAVAGLKQHYAKKPRVKTPNAADKKYDDMLSQLRDVLKNRSDRQ